MKDIDTLYQLPLDEFTSARNALAKEAKQPQIKALEKPNIAAWAVNQLYWKHREVYDQVTRASERLRSEHRKLLGGKSSDIRDTEKAHREALRAAVDTIKRVLAEGGHPASDATMTAVQETLEALPSTDAPGRLTRPLKPMGFEALAGLSIAPGARPALRVVKSAGKQEAETKPDPRKERELAKAREREERERKERQREAEKQLKVAEAAMLRAEEAVKKAEKSLAELKAERDRAVNAYQRARLRAHE